MITLIKLVLILNLVFVKSKIINDKEQIIYSKGLNIEKIFNVKDYDNDNYYYNDYENANNNEKIDYDYNEFQSND